MDNLKGSLYGFIVGDALGVPVEFYKKEFLDTRPITDMVANAQRKTSIGYWSDDTAMTLCTMESITNFKEINYKDIMDKFMKWVLEGYMTANDVCFGIGQRTLKALTFYNREINNPVVTKDYKDYSWIPLVGTLSQNPTDKMTSGNGSLMRVLPVVIYLNNTNKTIEEKISIMKDISSMTHSSDDCILSCIYYMILIENLIKTNDMLESFKMTSKYLLENYDNAVEFNRILNNEFLNLSIEQIKSTGYVIDTLEASLWCLYNSNDYKEAVLKAVNLGGDTDTIAAITGSLAGLYYGYGSIPNNWIESLMKKELVDKKIIDFLISLE